MENNLPNQEEKLICCICYRDIDIKNKMQFCECKYYYCFDCQNKILKEKACCPICKTIDFEHYFEIYYKLLYSKFRDIKLTADRIIGLNMNHEIKIPSGFRLNGQFNIYPVDACQRESYIVVYDYYDQDITDLKIHSNAKIDYNIFKLGFLKYLKNKIKIVHKKQMSLTQQIIRSMIASSYHSLMMI